MTEPNKINEILTQIIEKLDKILIKLSNHPTSSASSPSEKKIAPKSSALTIFTDAYAKNPKAFYQLKGFEEHEKTTSKLPELFKFCTQIKEFKTLLKSLRSEPTVPNLPPQNLAVPNLPLSGLTEIANKSENPVGKTENPVSNLLLSGSEIK